MKKELNLLEMEFPQSNILLRVIPHGGYLSNWRRESSTAYVPTRQKDENSMGSKRELYDAAKEIYLNYVSDDNRSELTLEEAEALLELIDDVASEVSSNIFLGDVIDDIVDELIELFPRFNETERRLEELRRGEGHGYI